jgi:hypothetical protein
MGYLHSHLCYFPKAHANSPLNYFGEKISATHNVKVVNLQRLVISTPSSEPFQIIIGIDFHGTLLHLSIDAHTVVYIVHLMRF